MPPLEAIAVAAEKSAEIAAKVAVEVGKKIAEVTVEEAKEIAIKSIEAAEKTKDVVVERLDDIKAMSPEQLREQMEKNLSEKNSDSSTKTDEGTKTKEGFTDEQKQRIKDEAGWSDDKINELCTYDVNECKSDIFTDSPFGRQNTFNELVEVKFEAIQNKLDGCAREEKVGEELRKKYPPESGFTVLREVYLRDENGEIVVDPVTGTKRRVDFAVVKDGNVVDMVEVTSKTAPKEAQIAKENRIRNAGGNYIKDYNNNLIRIPDSVKTRIDRRD